MNGMAMMLKAMGLDPEEMTNSINGFGQTIVSLKVQMDRIEQKLDMIIGIGGSVDDSEDTEIEEKEMINGH